MKKLAIVIDSFSGLCLNEIKENKNIFFLSLLVEIGDDKIINEGDKPASEALIEEIKNTSSLKTSLPSLPIMQNLIEKLNNEYENVIFLPIASHMSGTYNALSVFTKNYKNMIVIDNNFVGDTYLEVGLKAISMMEQNGANLEEVISYIKDTSTKTIGFIVLDDLSWMIKSGRLKGIKKHIVSSGNLSPIIKVYNKLSIAGISRTKSLAIKKVFQKLNQFCVDNSIIGDFVYKIVYSYGENNLKIAEKYANENDIKFKSKLKSPISVYIHTGYGAIYIGVTPKI